MSNPFNFKIRMSLEKRLRRRLLYAVTAAVMTAAFAAGFLTVYVNSYNILHSEPMKVFEVCETSGGTGIIILNRLFELHTAETATADRR